MDEHYINQAFHELHKCDGLTIMGRGLGINLLYSKFVQFYSTNLKHNKPLVFCINGSGFEESLTELCLAEGTRPDELPKVSFTTSPIDITYSINNVYFIRILIMKLTPKSDAICMQKAVATS